MKAKKKETSAMKIKFIKAEKNKIGQFKHETGRKRGDNEDCESRVKYKQELNRLRVEKFRSKMTAAQIEEKKRKDRERYKNKKQQGLVKSASDRSKKEKKAIREKWRNSSERYRNRQKLMQRETSFLEAGTPPQTDEESIQDDTSRTKIILGRKKVKRDRAKAYRRLSKAEKKIATLNRSVERYRKRIHRLKMKFRGKDSPNSKVQTLTQGLNLPKEVKKQLLFGEALKAELSQNMRNVSDEREKQIIGKVVSGPIMQKYRLIGETSNILSYKRHKKQRNSLNLGQYERKQRNTKYTFKIRKEIQEFLERDDNSRMCPGKKDYVRKGRNKKQKRLLINTLSNLHDKFKKERPLLTVSYASFRRHKPFWIVPPSKHDRETCACVKHSNVSLIVKRLYASRLLDTSNTDALVNTLVCDKKNKECMFNVCSVCKGNQCEISAHNLAFLNDTLNYYQWESVVEEKIIKNKTKNIRRTTKLQKRETVSNLFRILNAQLIEYKKHVFMMHYQMKELQLKKKSLGKDEILIQVDYSENYVAKYSDEIQAMHFGASKRQVSLHTGLYYFYDANSNCVKSQCFCSASDALDHQAYAVWAHLEEILQHIAYEYPETTSLHFWSDGPSSQYRNKFNLFLLRTRVPMIFENIKNISWNYSESGHGKGPMDGVGGTLKRTADAKVIRGEDIISATDFVTKLEGGAIQLWEVTNSEIEEAKKQIPKNVLPIPCIMAAHQVTWNRDAESDVHLRQLSCFVCEFGEECQHFPIKRVVKNATRNNQILVNVKPVTKVKILSDILLEPSTTTRESCEIPHLDIQVKEGLCYTCTFQLKNNDSGMKCKSCVRTYHARCILKFQPHIPQHFVCQNCEK